MDKWLVRHVQAMYKNVPSQVRVNGSFSDDFLQQVNLNYGLKLCLLLFIIVLEVLNREMISG